MTVPTVSPNPSPSRRSTGTERALLGLEMLLAVGAYAGAVGFLTGGIDIGSAVEDLPFGSTTFAGWALLVVNGLLPTVVVVGAWRGRPWAEAGHLAVGLALTGWIVVQVGLLGWPPHWLQILYFVYGCTVTVLALRLLRMRQDTGARRGVVTAGTR